MGTPHKRTLPFLLGRTAKLPEDEPMPTTSPGDNTLLILRKSHRFFYSGRYTLLYFESVSLVGGTEHKDATNCTALKIPMEGNIMDMECPRKSKYG